MQKPSKSYYDRLELPQDADWSHVKQKYKELAKLHHPDKNTGSKEATEKFQKIAEAYVVLEEYYKKIGATGKNTEKPKPEKPKIQDPPIKHDLYVTLEEIFTGCTKPYVFKRNVVYGSGTTKPEEKALKIKIPRGCLAGKVFTFPKEGDQHPDRIPADIIFTIREEPHPHFKRDESDLVYTLSIDKRFVTRSFEVPAISGDEHKIDVRFGETQQILKGCGLPSDSGRGNIRINIEYSVKIEEETPDLPVEYPLRVSLEEIYHGCTKHESIERKTLNGVERKTFTIKIRRGCKEGEKITFYNEGDRNHGRIPANIIYIVTSKPHNVFTRVGADLHSSVNVEYDKVFETRVIEVSTITGSKEQVNIKFGIREKRLPRQGLPFSNNSERRGSLNIKLNYVKVENSRKDTNEQKAPTQDPPVEFPVYVTLLEVFSGCTKFEKFYRQRGGGSEEFKIHVSPGCVEGHKVTFYKKGNRYPDRIPADIIYVIHTKANPVFKRVASDLHTTINIEYDDDFVRRQLNVPTLHGQELTVDVRFGDQQISLPEQGLPQPYNESKRGNLIVKFNYIKKPRKRNSQQNFIQDPPVERPLRITLKEVLTGCKKIEKIRRKAELGFEEKTFEIDVKPGWKAGTRIKFDKEGDRNFGRISADVVFIVQEIPHHIFTRNGNDLYCTKDIEYDDIFISKTIKIPIVDGTTTTTEVKFGQKEKTLYNHGLPFPKNPLIRGDLIVNFSYRKTPKKQENERQRSNYSEQSFIQDPPDERSLYVTLNEVFTGCTKIEKIKRKTGFGFEEKTFEINVKPGWKAGTKIRFHKEGDRNFGRIPADVVFILQNSSHPIFTREGSNLYCTKNVEFVDGCDIETVLISTIEGGTIKIEVAFGQSEKTILGQGLPLPMNPTARGCLIVKFNCTRKPKTEAMVIQRPIHVSLKEIYNGCTKTERIQRLGDSGRREWKLFVIDIPPGAETGSKITFQQEGSRKPGQLPADVVYVIQVAHHPEYQREDCNLIHHMNIDYDREFNSRLIKVPTLMGSKVNQIIRFNQERIRIQDYGLPRPGNLSERGDLIVYFSYTYKPNSNESQPLTWNDHDPFVARSNVGGCCDSCCSGMGQCCSWLCDCFYNCFSSIDWPTVIIGILCVAFIGGIIAGIIYLVELLLESITEHPFMSTGISIVAIVLIVLLRNCLCVCCR